MSNFIVACLLCQSASVLNQVIFLIYATKILKWASGNRKETSCKLQTLCPSKKTRSNQKRNGIDGLCSELQNHEKLQLMK